MNTLLHAFERKDEKSKLAGNWLWRQMLMLLIFISAFTPGETTAQVVPTIDGNPVDWNAANFNLFAIKKYQGDAFGNGVVDNQFTEGSKDFFLANQLVWSISQTKAKNDIANGAAIIKDGILYFAGDRVSNNGDAQIGFWLYLNGTGPVTVGGNNIFSPPHVDGDVLVLADFTGGGRNATVTIYQWYTGANPLPPGTSIVPNTNGNLRTTTLVGTVAENNDGQYSIPTGWSFPTATYDYNMFFEGRVDLTALGVLNLCNTSFLLETRSSQSITASLDDFVGGSFNVTPTVTVNSPTVCEGSLPVTITATPGDGTPGQFNYTWTVPAGVADPGNVASFQASVAGTYSVVITRKGLDCPSEPGSGVLTIKKNSSSTNNLTICSNQLPYTWDGLVFTAAGTKQKTGLTNAAGCDSTATFNLTVNQTTSSTNNLTICSNQLPYTWDGLVFTAAGTKQKTGLTNAAGCDSTATFNLTVNPTTSSRQERSICANELPYSWGGFTFDAAGTKVKDGLTNQYGCDSIATYVLSVNPLPIVHCTVDSSKIDITSADHNTKLDVDLSGNVDTDPTHYSYSWSHDGAGSFNFSNIKNPVYTASTLDAGQVVSFKVIVTNNLTGCIDSSTCSVTVNTAGKCPDVPTSEICNGSTNTYTADRAPATNETWKWSVNNGATIVGADNGQSVTVTAGGQNFTLTLTISFDNTALSPIVCDHPVTVTPCGGYCTYTQGKYGNTSPACDGDGVDGSGPAITYPTVLDMIKAMLGVGGSANPLIIGSGSNTVTIPATATAAALLNKSMPGGGSARELLSGNCVADNVPSLSSCWTPGTNTATTYITKQGKINNVLLSQTITLGLNMRVSSGLTNFVLQAGTFATAAGEGGCGSTTPKQRSCYYNELGQLVVVNEYIYKTIPESVISALNSKTYPLTVGGLYQLANDALGNADGTKGTEGGASLSDINQAVSSINEGFDECRIFIGWDVKPCSVPTTKVNLGGSGIVTTPGITADAITKLTVSAYPNPFVDKVNFVIASPVSGKASLEVYSIFGQKLQTVFEGYLTAGRSQVVEFRPGAIAAGTLVYRFTINGKQVTGKVISTK